MASSASLGADRKERIILLVDTPMDRYAERGRFRRDLVGAASGQTYYFGAECGRTWGREGGIGAANNIWGSVRQIQRTGEKNEEKKRLLDVIALKNHFCLQSAIFVDNLNFEYICFFLDID